jgi:hypothetical protein
MNLNFATLEKARQFAQKRTANGIATKVTDNGKDAVKRYVVSINNTKGK